MKKIGLFLVVSGALTTTTLLASQESDLHFGNRVEGVGVVYKVVNDGMVVISVKDDESCLEIRRHEEKMGEVKRLKSGELTFNAQLANTINPLSIYWNGYDEGDNYGKSFQFLNKFTEGKDVEYVCWGYERNGYECSLTIGGIDVGTEMIERGYSDYDKSNGKHPYLHNEYVRAMRGDY